MFIFTLSHISAFSLHTSVTRHENDTQWWAAALILVLMVAKNMF